MKSVTPEREHFRRIEVREFEKSDLGDNMDVDYYLASQYKTALIDDEGEVITIMGGIVSGISCHTWLVASKRMYQHRVATMKAVKRLHKDAIKNGVRAFFTYNLPEFEAEMKFVQAIGYKEQARTTEFDDGKERVFFVMEIT